MILLNLVTSNKAQIETIVNLLLKHKFATNVIVSNPETAYFSTNETEIEHTEVYKLQFATKALLFSEIEAALAKEFPHKEFYIYATPIVQTTTRVFDRIQDNVKMLENHPNKEIDI